MVQVGARIICKVDGTVGKVFEPRRSLGEAFLNDTTGAISGAGKKPLDRSFTTLSRTWSH